uniref:Putative secreted protein n=1 Tax=Anopheles triannulatus TaxID=58253 RepID=A0A2M4B4T3_9DIPT
MTLLLLLRLTRPGLGHRLTRCVRRRRRRLGDRSIGGGRVVGSHHHRAHRATRRRRQHHILPVLAKSEHVSDAAQKTTALLRPQLGASTLAIV